VQFTGKGYENGFGFSQEASNGMIGVGCVYTFLGFVRPTWAELSQLHNACTADANNQGPDCMAAAHRACENEYSNKHSYKKNLAIFVEHAFGMIIGKTNVNTVVACAVPGWTGQVTLDRAKSFHSGCDAFHKSQTPDCAAAFHRFCQTQYCSIENRQCSIGLSQEVGNGAFGVHCFGGDGVHNLKTHSN
jgi:hypothetical protein